MENFKILKNRAELTKEQLANGMDFNKIKINAASSKKSVLKLRIIKIILAGTVVTLSLLVYKLIAPNILETNLERPSKAVKNLNVVKEHSPLNNDKKNNAVNDTLPQVQVNRNKSLSNENGKLKITGKQTGKSTNNKINAEKNNVINQNPPGVSVIKKCVGWIPGNSYFPKIAQSKLTFNSDVELDYIDKEVVNKMDSISCIWLTLQTSGNGVLKIEDQFKNFGLLRGNFINAKQKHPFMIKLNNEPGFLSGNFKGKNVIINYTKKIDIFLFFKNENPKPGHKLNINNRIAVITI